MNTEEKAKAYDDALDRMKHLVIVPKNEKALQTLKETIFPELAESDNERIRHWLIGLISADYKDDNFPSGIKKTDVLNWLKKESVVYEQGMYYYDGKKFLYCQQEKPKVAIPTLDSVKQNKSDDERILASIADCVGLMGEDGDVFSNHNVTKVQVFSWLEKQNAQKSSIEEILTKAGLKPYKDGNQWCILAGDNIQEGICGFGDTINEALYQFLMEVLEKQKVLIAIPDELVKNYKHFCEIGCREAAMLINAINGISEQKEQKPAEWGEEDEKMLKWLCRIIHSRVVNKELSLAEESELGKWLDKWLDHEPQHKKKWSEVDEDCLKRAIWYVENPAPTVVKNTNLVLWLQSLPERFNLQPKEEWSVEDEDRIRQIERIAQEAGCTQKLQEEIHDWLKSRRPSWKPSEEQMDAFEDAMTYIPEFYKPKSTLASLLRDLKKLK